MGIIEEDEQEEKKLFTLNDLRSLMRISRMLQMRLQAIMHIDADFVTSCKYSSYVDREEQNIIDVFWHGKEKSSLETHNEKPKQKEDSRRDRGYN